MSKQLQLPLMKHGHCANGRRSPEYQVWCGMIKRCTNPKHKSYKDYGGRGIKVCKRWFDFRNFLVDMGKRPKGLTLDRVDVDKHYCKGNCEWATWSHQMKNKRKYKWLRANQRVMFEKEEYASL